LLCVQRYPIATHSTNMADGNLFSCRTADNLSFSFRYTAPTYVDVTLAANQHSEGHTIALLAESDSNFAAQLFINLPCFEVYVSPSSLIILRHGRGNNVAFRDGRTSLVPWREMIDEETQMTQRRPFVKRRISQQAGLHSADDDGISWSDARRVVQDMKPAGRSASPRKVRSSRRRHDKAVNFHPRYRLSPARKEK
jgi:hypothetical protein